MGSWVLGKRDHINKMDGAISFSSTPFSAWVLASSLVDSASASCTLLNNSLYRPHTPTSCRIRQWEWGLVRLSNIAGSQALVSPARASATCLAYAQTWKRGALLARMQFSRVRKAESIAAKEISGMRLVPYKSFMNVLTGWESQQEAKAKVTPTPMTISIIERKREGLIQV